MGEGGPFSVFLEGDSFYPLPSVRFCKRRRAGRLHPMQPPQNGHGRGRGWNFCFHRHWIEKSLRLPPIFDPMRPSFSPSFLSRPFFFILPSKKRLERRVCACVRGVKTPFPPSPILPLLVVVHIITKLLCLNHLGVRRYSTANTFPSKTGFFSPVGRKKDRSTLAFEQGILHARVWTEKKWHASMQKNAGSIPSQPTPHLVPPRWGCQCTGVNRPGP